MSGVLKPPAGVLPRRRAGGPAFDFPLNEACGGTLLDATNGAILLADSAGVLTWGAGPEGPALVFAGAPHDAARAASVPAFNGVDWSVFLLAATSASLASGQHALASRGPEGGVPGQFYFYFQSGVLTLDIPYVAGSVVSFAYTPTIGDWHSYGVTKSGTTYTLWIDGRPVASASYSGSPVVSGPLKLGTYDGTNCWPGSISRFRGWNRALSATKALAEVESPWAAYRPRRRRRSAPRGAVPAGASAGVLAYLSRRRRAS